jgi:hypothetical protein
VLDQGGGLLRRRASGGRPLDGHAPGHPQTLLGRVGDLREADLAALDAAFPPGAAVGDRYPENLERLIDKG